MGLHWVIVSAFFAVKAPVTGHRKGASGTGYQVYKKERRRRQDKVHTHNEKVQSLGDSWILVVVFLACNRVKVSPRREQSQRTNYRRDMFIIII